MSDDVLDPSQIKNFFNADLIAEFGDEVQAVFPAFDKAGFIAFACEGLAGLELKARTLRICQGFMAFLPEDFDEAQRILLQSMGKPDDPSDPEAMGRFRFMPHVAFLSEKGIASPTAALEAMPHFTKFFSCEFAIRVFIIDHYDLAMPRLKAWSQDSDWRVRRLASEGSRPRLPWGQQIKDFMADPAPVFDLLNTMHNDPELIVRRSVANNLNDIAKDHPNLAAEAAQQWFETKQSGSQWTVKHGLRTLIKQGHKQALAVLGYEGGEGVVVQDLRFDPQQPEIGGQSELSFRLANGEDSAVSMVVDFALVRTLAGGKTGKKVFKLKMLRLKPSAKIELATKLNFKQLSTRTYYPGPHAVIILINGREAHRHDFELHAAPQA